MNFNIQNNPRFSKKILVLSEIHEGGEWISNQRLFESLNKFSNNLTKVSLIGFVDKYSPDQGAFQDVVLIPHSSAAKPFSFIKKLILDFLNARNQIKMIISKDNFDFFWTTYYFMIFPILTLRHLGNVKIIYHFQGTRSPPFGKFSDLDYSQIIVRTLEFIALVCADIIVIPSKETQNFIARRLGIFFSKKKFFIIENCITPKYFRFTSKTELEKFKKKLNIPKKSKSILYCGRMSQRKGLESLVEAFNTLALKKFCLILAYPTSNQEKAVILSLQDKIKKTKTKNYVKFVKDLDENDLINLYQIADVLILPSELEMAPLVIIESLASGTPCIGTKTGNMYRLLSTLDPSLVLSNNNPKEIYEKLKVYFELPSKKIKQISIKGRKLAKNYSSENAAKKFMELVEHLEKNSFRESQVFSH